MKFGVRVVNQVNVLLVSELGKYLILKFLLFDISPASVRYLAMCLMVNSLVLLISAKMS